MNIELDSVHVCFTTTPSPSFFAFFFINRRLRFFPDPQKFSIEFSSVPRMMPRALPWYY
jgi:hypothetical protein